MKNNFYKGAAVLILLLINVLDVFSQEKSIKDLAFLIGTWEVREDNEEEKWWEQSTRTAHYTLDSTYIELESVAISSSGKERTYRWLIHYNSKAEQFEMVSMYSNWHKVQFDILTWDIGSRQLIIRNGVAANSDEYHERYGEIVFDENFNNYIWKGENKYGDRDDPGIWKYIEKGLRIK